MSTPLESFSKMLTATGAKFKKTTEEGTTHLDIQTNDGLVKVLFLGKGGEFKDAHFFPHNAFLRIRTESFLLKNHSSYDGESVEKTDDYELLFDMFESAPVQNGEWFEAVSEDGKYSGIVYNANGSRHDVVFVCLMKTGQFLGVFGI